MRRDITREVDAIRAKLGVLLDGHALADIALTTAATAVPHKLGRKPQGYLIAGQDADATVWAPTAANTTYLYLQASASVNINLWVY